MLEGNSIYNNRCICLNTSINFSRHPPVKNVNKASFNEPPLPTIDSARVLVFY